MPDKLQEIGKRALSETGIIEVKIPASVETIGESAFDGCKSL